MRELILQAVVNDPTINLLGITDENAFAVDVDTPEQRPFLQARWGANEVALSKTEVGRRTLTLWVHDEPGDYGRIDTIIFRLRSLIPTLEGESNGLGHLIAAEWSGDSEDLSDDGHRTIARWTSFSLVGTGQ